MHNRYASIDHSAMDVANFSKLDSSRSRMSSIDQSNKKESSNGFALRRDHSMNNASRELFQKEISYIKIHCDYEKCTRETDEARLKHNMIKSLRNNHPNIDISYNQIMNSNIHKLNQLIEKKKFEELMHTSATRIQRSFRNKKGKTLMQFAVSALLVLKRKR